MSQPLGEPYQEPIEEKEEPKPPKYMKPKVLLIDMPENVDKRLKEEGFNAVSGTFGTPYIAPPDRMAMVLGDVDLPNHTEQEIIFVNLAIPEPVDPPSFEGVDKRELAWWTDTWNGIVDPRPLTMSGVRKDFNRILHHGGIFIIFAKPRRMHQFVFGRNLGGQIHREGPAPEVDNWSFLSVLSNNQLVIDRDPGEEVSPARRNSLTDCLSRYLDGASYSATIQQTYNIKDEEFHPLLLNKYLLPVGVAISPQRDKGLIIILPDRMNNESLCLELLKDVLPSITPKLFPDFEGMKWVERDEYEHRIVLGYQNKKEEIVKEATKQIHQLDEKISEARTKREFLHELLTQTGAKLVEAVKKSLSYIGFEKVIDVDEEEDSTQKQEDLQILDDPNPVLLEVKGISGLPREGDTLQVSKYVLRRMREWERTDVRGLSLMNHQRHLPPLDRDNNNVFTPAQIEDAENHGFGLMTTWDLFRLIRAMMRWKWPKDVVRSLFYQDGRIEAIPTHYLQIGCVAHFYDKVSVVSIEIDEGCQLQVGDRLGFVMPVEFHEEEVQSLQVDKKSVEAAKAGQRVGHKTSLPRSALPDGTPVYLVESTQE